MKIHRCKECNEYKYIESNGKCRDCYSNSESDRDDYNISYNPQNIIKTSRTNQLILGMTGSGKTVGNKIEIAEMLDNKNVDVYITDPLGSYTNFVQEYNGSVYSLGPNGCFNIFNMETLQNKNEFKNKIERIYDLICHCYREEGLRMSPKESQLIQISIEETYRDHGIDSSTVTKNPTNLPDISDLKDTIRSIRGNPSQITKHSATQNQIKKIKGAMKGIESRIENIENRFGLSNNMSSNFNSQLTYFDLQGINSRSKGIKLHMIFNEVWEQSISSQNDTVFYIDNARYLFEAQNCMDSISKAFAQSRNYNTDICLSMTQGKKVLQNGTGRDILANTSHFRLHRQKDKWIKNVLNISDQDASYLSKASVGSSSDPAEVLIRRAMSNDTQEQIEIKDNFLSKIH